MKLFPQLLQRDARQLASELIDLPLAELVARARAEHPNAIYGATGGQKVSPSELERLQRRIREIGGAEGFRYDDPDASPVIERGHGDALDLALTRLLIDEADLTPNQASRPGVWAFFGCVLAPELVRWRFPGGDAGTRTERFTGNRLRNLYGRLWWRGRLLCDDAAADKLWLVAALGEDELVQITERPNAAGFSPLACELARHLVSVWHADLGINRAELLRAVMKRLLRWMTLTRFEVLSPEELSGVISDLYEQTLTGLGLVAHRQPEPAISAGWRAASWQDLSLEGRFRWIEALDDEAVERLKVLQNAKLPDWREYQTRWKLLFQLDATLGEIVDRGGAPAGQSTEALASAPAGSWVREVDPGLGARLVSNLRAEDLEGIYAVTGWPRGADWTQSSGQRQVRRAWNGSAVELLAAVGPGGCAHLARMLGVDEADPARAIAVRLETSGNTIRVLAATSG